MQLRYLPRYYQVSPQDTLISISFKVGIPYWKWLESNPQVTARGLVPGESLTIPPRDAMLELPVIQGKRIVISITEQRMWVYENGELIREHLVSTGIPNSPTMPGLFQVKSHYLNAYASNWNLTMPHFLGIYHAVPNFLNGIHGLPLLSNGVRLWANVLGQPASYGCVILDLEAAEALYSWAEDGVVVEIRS
jgi:lipoprotein-anchoring transpeptidase ErfK/SrfK